jgi:superfamily II DNA/RNA helicase
VINFDLPVMHSIRGQQGIPAADFTTFVHRIGRTGRAERAGTAINLVETDADAALVNSIDRYFSSNSAAAAGVAPKSMFTWWNSTDIAGLVKEIERRQADREEA